MPKSDVFFVKYFVEMCIHIIPNIFLTMFREICAFFKVTVHFILWPVRGATSPLPPPVAITAEETQATPDDGSDSEEGSWGTS